jgi:hypothetical protein
MAKTLMLALTLLVSAAWLLAQNQAPQAGSSQTGAASGQTSVEGCLQGSNGNFTLADNSGNTYKLEGDTSKLTEHVGHEVQITGSTSAGSSASSGTMTGGSQGQQTLTVSDVKHISPTCKSASK